MRMQHELRYHDKAQFITLTYHPLELPPNDSLRREDAFSFMKRYKERVRYQEKPSFRYFLAGEYGEENADKYFPMLNGRRVGRPHYHAIIFGHDFEDKIYWKDSDKGYPQFISEELTELWPYGHATTAAAVPETFSYTAGYITDKVTGKKETVDEAYTRVDTRTGVVLFPTCEREFQSQSKGLGRKFVEEFETDLYKGYLMHEGKKRSLPRYYLKVLEELNPEAAARIQTQQWQNNDPWNEETHAHRTRAKEELLIENRKSYERQKL